MKFNQMTLDFNFSHFEFSSRIFMSDNYLKAIFLSLKKSAGGTYTKDNEIIPTLYASGRH